MWIVKLGGSLMGTPELAGWLELIAKHGDGKVIIVPGGGLLADAVKEAQELTGVDDAIAHRLAVMSMDQYGIMMSGLNPDLVTAASELELAERGWQHRGIVWLPSHMVCADETIPTNWQVTSDSLAAWLAMKMNASHLILVKSIKPQGDKISVDSLIKNGVVDAYFGDYIAGQPFKTWVMGKQDFLSFEGALTPTEAPPFGIEVRCAWN